MIDGASLSPPSSFSREQTWFGSGGSEQPRSDEQEVQMDERSLKTVSLVDGQRGGRLSSLPSLTQRSTQLAIYWEHYHLKQE